MDTDHSHHSHQIDSDQTVLDVQDVSVTLDGTKIIEHVSLVVKKGEVVAIVGPNGAGKSTLFRALLGLIPFEGMITWQANVRIGYVPQQLSIERNLPITVGEFMELKGARDKQIHDVIAAVGLPSDIHRRPLGVLSGGELQRTLIAWALIGDPTVLLFDEPTAGIDIGGEETIYQLLHGLQDSRGLTILLISHDLNVVYQYANTVLCLNKKMICFGEPASVLDPKALAQLYGGEAKFYHHDHHDDTAHH